ncbi:MAG: hypothetical protein ACYCY7_06175 [Gallionella sp.]
MTNLQLAHSQLLTQLTELNRYPMRSRERLNILEQLRDTVHHVQSDYSRRLISKPLPLNENELLVFVAIVGLWQTMSLGYRRCLQAYEDGDSQLAQSGALLCQRGLLYGGKVIFEHLRTGYEFDARLWQQLHGLYAFCEKNGLQLKEIPDPLNGFRTHSTCHGIYIKILLACYARPAELNHPQLQRLDHWLTRWGDALPLERSYTTSRGDAQPLALDLDGPHGLRSIQLANHGENTRYLAMVPLSKLMRIKTILLQQGQTPQQLELGEYSRNDCIESLIFFHQCWCENRNTRSDQRNPVEKPAQIFYKPEVVHALLSGKSPAQSAQTVNASILKSGPPPAQVWPGLPGNDRDTTGQTPETWMVLNEGILGAQLTRKEMQGSRVWRNQLIALRFADTESFILGVISWANVTLGGKLRVGVRYLPGSPLAVALRTRDPDLPVAGGRIPAFFLQAVPALTIPPSLVMPREWFDTGRVIEIMHTNGKTQNAKLGFRVERGMNYQRVSFTLA